MQLPGIFVTILLIVSACAEAKEEAVAEGGHFEQAGMKLFGIENKVGLMKLNGDQDVEMATPGHYEIFFWGVQADTGSSYRLTGRHPESGEVRTLYEWPLQHFEGKGDAVSGAKFAVEAPGEWLFTFYIDEEEFASFSIVMNEGG